MDSLRKCFPSLLQVVKFLVLVSAVICVIGRVECRKSRILEGSSDVFEYSAISCRGHSASIEEFGGVGDGRTLNTKAFQEAVNQLSQYASEGGAQLYVPAGKWLTGSFNLTSHFTLYLHKDAVLLASQDIGSWPVVDPLPSYGHGRDAAGGRYISLLFGTNLTDVVITGDNGTIDGQGALWWQQFHKKKLKFTRPYLIEIMHSDTVQISNLTLVNSPSWNVHPVYSSAAIALGSEMSGGIQDVRAQDIVAINTESGVRIKTAVGRGGFVKDIYVKGMKLQTMKWVFWMTGNYGSHADNHYDPHALPAIQGINYRDVVADDVKMAARLEGISGDPFTGICIANVTIGMAQKAKKYPWTCADVEGIASGVVPTPCASLPDQGPEKVGMCDFPQENLEIENVELRSCSYQIRY